VCDDRSCLAVIDGEAMYFDDNHLSLPGARRLVGLIRSPDLWPSVSSANVNGTAATGEHRALK
jgi:hypothetical protein